MRVTSPTHLIITLSLLILSNSLYAFRECPQIQSKCSTDFSHCTIINEDFSNADLKGANFSYAKLINVTFNYSDLSNAVFTGATLKNVDMKNANLQKSNFDKVRFSHIDMRKAQFQRATFNNAKLIGIRADDAVFTGADFTRAKLLAVSFNQSDLRFTNFKHASINFSSAWKTDFLGANLKMASFFYTFFQNTACPSGQIVSYPETCKCNNEVTFVSLGNSLSAGMKNSGLRIDFQKKSFPNKIAQGLYIDNFEQPYIDYPGISTQAGKSPLYIDPVTGFPVDSALIAPPVFLNSSLPRPYNNLGVPGATLFDILNTVDAQSQGGFNPFFEIILRPEAFGRLTQLEQTVSLNPTFITVWAGNNDILGGVLQGTIVEGVTVTPLHAFEQMIIAITQNLLQETESEILLANLPSMTSIPFVTTVPKYVFDPSTFQVIEGNIPFVTEEKDVEYVLLSALDLINTGTGIPSIIGGNDIPLPGNVTLTKNEALLANTIIDAYNLAISKIADVEDRIFLVDANKLLSDISSGVYEGHSANWPIVDPENSIFSLDGVHLNEKGADIVSELFIKSILKNVKSRW